VEKEEKENKGFPFHLHRYCNSNQYLVFQHILECFFLLTRWHNNWSRHFWWLVIG